MELDASETERKRLEYSTQFFEFTPDAYIDSVTGPSVSIIEEHLEAAKERCASEFVGKVNDKDLEDAFALIKDAYTTNANEVFEKFGRYLKKNIFNVPQDTVLPEDRVHLNPEAKGYTGQKLQNDLKELDDLRQEFANVKYRKAVLQEKLANLQIVAERQQKLLKQVEQFEGEKCEINTMIDQQMDILKGKLSNMKPVLDQIENNLPANNESSGELKRKLEVNDAIIAKKQNVDKEN